MKIGENVNLKSFNTFGINVQAKYFVEVNSIEDLKDALQFSKDNKISFLIIGGGSNVLFSCDWDGIIIKINIKGIQVLEDTNDYNLVKAYAGEDWHQLVEWSLVNNLNGIENMSLIPGKCGAAPMQNIGAYGVELKDIFEELEALNIETFEISCFSNSNCEFGYRESVFKNKLKGKYVIISITLKLSKKLNLKISYGDIRKILEEKQIKNPTARDVSDAVIQIRKSKLPDPFVLGNAGSFFKNPVIEEEEFKKIIEKHPDIPSFNQVDGIKIPAGWLIEKAGWKGKRTGNTGVHEKQALVLINYGDSDGKEIFELATKIIEDVKHKFGITLHPEVNLIQ